MEEDKIENMTRVLMENGFSEEDKISHMTRVLMKNDFLREDIVQYIGLFGTLITNYQPIDELEIIKDNVRKILELLEKNYQNYGDLGSKYCMIFLPDVGQKHRDRNYLETNSVIRYCTKFIDKIDLQEGDFREILNLFNINIIHKEDFMIILRDYVYEIRQDYKWIFKLMKQTAKKIQYHIYK